VSVVELGHRLYDRTPSFGCTSSKDMTARCTSAIGDLETRFLMHLCIKIAQRFIEEEHGGDLARAQTDGEIVEDGQVREERVVLKTMLVSRR
jgi:hypothetical protein